MVSQLEPFFAAPPKDQKVHIPLGGLLFIDEAIAQHYRGGGCDIAGYDVYGRRGGVWIRKPRSSRPGSAGLYMLTIIALQTQLITTSFLECRSLPCLQKF